MNVEMRSEDDSQPASDTAENVDDVDGEDSTENEGKIGKVEADGDSDSDDDDEAINRHFRKALADYHDFNVALVSVNFIMEHPNPETDKIWDELLTVYALPCKRGREMFQPWRKYHEYLDIY